MSDEFESPPWPWSDGIPDKFVYGYMPAYLRIAAELGPAASVCEIGVYLGHGLRLWQSLFPFGQVWGVDQDRRAVWPDGTVAVLSRQDDPALPGFLADGAPFDLIVDDASHVGTVSAATFTSLWPLIAPGGYYVIEDCWPCNSLGLPGMVSSLLRLLEAQNAECDEITYRYGMAIVHKRREPAEACLHREELIRTPVCPHHNAGLSPTAPVNLMPVLPA
jgi:hypothetical protein